MRASASRGTEHPVTAFIAIPAARGRARDR